MSTKDHPDQEAYLTRRHHHRPSLRFLVMWCPACGARKEHDGGDRYCRATDACVTVRGARSDATRMRPVEVATREGWNGL